MKEKDIRNRSVLDTYLKMVERDCLAFFQDGKGLVEVQCPACGSNAFVREFDKSRFNYVTCTVCKTLYARTRPTVEKLREFYDGSDSTKYWINEFFKPVAEARREKIFKPRAEDVVRRFGDDPVWLIGDIGAGFGLFLDELRKLWPGSKYIAIEPSSEQADICKGLGLHVERFLIEELKGYEESFDLLTAFELLEHLYDPGTFLSRVHKLLKPGGWLLMTALNGQGFDIQVLWEHYKNFYPPSHINFFNPGSLSGLIEKTGFIIQELTTPGQLDWDIVEGMIKNEKIDVDRFWSMIAYNENDNCKNALQDWIVQYNLSSHMRILVRKP